MKNVLTLAVAIVVFMASCGNSTAKKQNVNDQKDQVSEKGTDVVVKVVSTPSDKGNVGNGDTEPVARVNDMILDDIFQYYLKLTNEFVTGKKMGPLSAIDYLSLLTAQLGKDSKLSHLKFNIERAKTLEQKREAFSMFTNELVVQIKKVGVKSGKIYVYYCPSAVNGTGGHWLSVSKEIKNPYSDNNNSSDCGEIKETLK